ncbi:sensor histidine kinase [Solilutibacter silvestris]|uniref:Histidine kinase n=1 Tax=Solilutibacter silvestris TaxID=1645665 RepID=A0A2K1Q369_9GAMM|nr:histidine kinase [Lysobacter silvestris]PNS09463.1 Histidine kinase [Lysobacter silvestris]
MDRTSPSSEHPIDILWQPATLLSIFAAGELLAIILALGSPLASGSVLVKFGLASFAIQWVVLFTLSGLYLLRTKLTGFGARGVIVLAMTLMLLVTLLSGASVSSLFGDVFADQSAPWFVGTLRFYVCLLSMSTFGLLALRSHWSAQRAAWQTQQAELQALQARVDPHFLFNTLNTGVALVHARPDAAEQLLLDLADLFRAALAGPRSIMLADELDLARRYLDIEQLRFGPRLQVEWDAPDTLPHMLLPALSIQPLVENAIHHGIEPRMDGGVVTIRVFDEARDVVVEITNPLPDPSSSPRDRGHRVGQAAVTARLREAGGGFSAAVEGERYVARVRIPFSE